jgi:hypothetical protein
VLKIRFFKTKTKQLTLITHLFGEQYKQFNIQKLLITWQIADLAGKARLVEKNIRKAN